MAHIYVNDRTLKREVHDLLTNEAGIDEVRDGREIWGESIAAQRGGDLVAVADPDAWFTYYYWNDDAVAPDFARTIDIHRKPGYDPCELYIDPAISLPKLRIASFLLKKKLGIRGLLDVIPLDATLVKGSHGRDRVPADHQPVFLGAKDPVASGIDVHQAIFNAAR